MQSIKGQRGQKRHFYFVPATGEVHQEPPHVSEFPVFRLKLEAFEGVVAGLAAARVGRDGIIHHPEFLRWVCDQNTWLWGTGGPFQA